jgi:hypothetical protein
VITFTDYSHRATSCLVVAVRRITAKTCVEANSVSNHRQVHGLAGFFDSVLYKDVHISINPATFSTGMFSWFPLFFPLRCTHDLTNRMKAYSQRS